MKSHRAAKGVVFLALTFLVMCAATASGNRNQWFRVSLDHGEVDGFRWAVGAKGLSDEPLKNLCGLASLVAPPKEDAPFVEREDAVECGRLSTPSNSVWSSASFSAGSSRVEIVEVLFRPIVRRVVLTFSTGERKVFLLKAPSIQDQGRRAIPSFRFLAVFLQADSCIRRMIAFDVEGKRVLAGAGPTPCPIPQSR
jgi:hypothetical protein